MNLIDRDLMMEKYPGKGVHIRQRDKFGEAALGFAPVSAPAPIAPLAVRAPVQAVAAPEPAAPAAAEPLPSAAPEPIPEPAPERVVVQPVATPLPVKTSFQAEAMFDYDVFITVGHTDSVGSSALNQTLSEKRADAVRVYLIGQGVDASRIKGEGRSEKEPIASNDTSQGRAQNNANT